MKIYTTAGRIWSVLIIVCSTQRRRFTFMMPAILLLLHRKHASGAAVRRGLAHISIFATYGAYCAGITYFELARESDIA